MEKAIKKAIEEGYKGYGLTLDSGVIIYDRCLLDPLFWQALGRQQGWKSTSYTFKIPKKIITAVFKGKPITYIRKAHSVTHSRVIKHPMWKKYWHHFIDCLAEGGNADEFFDKLLK